MPRDNGLTSVPSHGADGPQETPEVQANRAARHERVKAGMAQIEEIDEQIAELRRQQATIRKNLEENEGVNLGGLADIKRYTKLDAPAAEKRFETFMELWKLKVQPKIDEAAAGQSDE